MPRPEIRGLKYFPFDTGFFRDKKIRLLRGEHDARGVEVYQRLLCKTYEDNGYYLLWNDSEDCALLADETGYSEEKIRLILSSCLKRSLFDDTLFKLGNVITSRSIQRRYFSAIRDTKIKAAAGGRYTIIYKDLCLLTDEDLAEFNATRVWLKVGQNYCISGININNSENNPDKSKINSTKKMKGNETILNDITEGVPLDSEARIHQHHQQNNEQMIIQYFINNIDESPSPLIIEKLLSWLDVFEADVILKAIEESVLNKKKSYKYIEGILKAWDKAKLFTLGLVDEHLKSWDDRKNKGTNNNINQAKPNRFVNFKQRDWDYALIEKLEQEYIEQSLERSGENEHE